jgi:hypothetical protein
MKRRRTVLTVALTTLLTLGEIDIDQALLSATGKSARVRSERLVHISAAGTPSPMCGAA